MIIKVVFLKSGIPMGREYSYYTPEGFIPNIGDTVQINEKAQGKVVAVNVPEEEVESFRHLMKTVWGKVDDEEDYPI